MIIRNQREFLIKNSEKILKTALSVMAISSLLQKNTSFKENVDPPPFLDAKDEEGLICALEIISHDLLAHSEHFGRMSLMEEKGDKK